MSKKNRAPYPDSYGYNYNPNAAYDSRAESKRLNKKLIPFNIIIAVIAIAGMVSLLLGNFWTFSASYTLDDEMLQSFIGSATEGASGEGTEGAEAEVPAFDFSQLDLDVTFGVSIALEPDVLLKAATADDTTAVKSMIDPLIDNLLGQATDVFKSALKSVTKMAVATAMQTINNELSSATEESGSVEVKEAVEAIDMAAVDNVVDELLAEDPDIDQVKADLNAILIAEAKLQYENAGETWTPEMEETLTTEMNGAVDGMVEQMGGEENFSVDNIVLNMVSENGFVEVGDGEVLTEESLTAALRDKVMGAMNEDTLRIAAIVVKVLAWLLIIPIACWALLALCAILRIFRKKKWVGMKLVKLTGAFPHIVFVGIPMLLVKFGPKLIAKLTATMGDSLSGITGMLGGISVSFVSQTWISAACVAALYLLGWLFYNRRKKKAKKATF